MGKKRAKEYLPDALKYLAETLSKAGVYTEGEGKVPSIRINLKGLEKAIKSLPRQERENVEKFWGLTGGINHSKKLNSNKSKDTAYVNMFNTATSSARNLFRLNYVSMYDENLHTLIRQINKKINKEGIDYISDLEAIKYLLAFFIFVWKGPKMSFEKDLMKVDVSRHENSICDEYTMLQYICWLIDEIPDNSINLKLLISLFEMLDYQDSLIIRRSIGIEIPQDCNIKQIDNIYTCGKTRTFKERVFKYGSWDVTTELILGGTLDLEMFMKELNKIRKDWKKIEAFKTGQKDLKTSAGVQTLDVYTIGGLEFTDPDEVAFLYIERDLIEPKT